MLTPSMGNSRNFNFGDTSSAAKSQLSFAEEEEEDEELCSLFLFFIFHLLLFFVVLIAARHRAKFSAALFWAAAFFLAVKVAAARVVFSQAGGIQSVSPVTPQRCVIRRRFARNARKRG